MLNFWSCYLLLWGGGGEALYAELIGPPSLVGYTYICLKSG
jgi:hypothetical protein